ncbi:MAG: tripartite tricarboxylate transporter substrate binding protein [Pseudomonadota bacterium]
MKMTTWPAICGALFMLGAQAMAADAFPSKPIRIVVNQAPGALLDTTTRLVAQKMAETLGQPVIVENRTGADGLLGIRYVKGAAADGYTILACSSTLAQAPALKLDPGYDLARDFTGVGPMNQAPLIMVGAPAQADKSLAEFIAHAKAKPEAMSFASGGVGTSTWMSAALFLHQAGIKLLHIPYKGSGAAMPDVIAGRVNIMFDAGSSAIPHVREGRLRAFGVSSTSRVGAFPEIPTLAEQGVPGYAYSVYLGLVAPAGTPKDVLLKLSTALRAATSSEAVRERFLQQGSEPFTLSPDEFTAFMKKDAQRVEKLVSDLGIAKQ